MSDTEATESKLTSATEAKKTKTKARETTGAKSLVITLISSGIGKPKGQRATIAGLGFKRLNQTVTREDTPAIRGMIRKISHLVKVQ